MLDHIIITVSDFERSRSFYLAALEPLGYEVVMEFGKGVGLEVAGATARESLATLFRPSGEPLSLGVKPS